MAFPPVVLLRLLHRLPLLLLLCLCAATTPAVSSLTKSVQAKPGCPDKCGNITVPYPFGFGNQNCYREGFQLSCDQTTSPPKLSMFGTVDPETGKIYNFGYNRYLEVTDISLEGQLLASSFMQYLCYQNSSASRDSPELARNSSASCYRFFVGRNSSTMCYKPGLASALREQARISQDWTNTPYTYSDSSNVFTAVGCSAHAYIDVSSNVSSQHQHQQYTSFQYGCSNNCSSSSATDTGKGYCQALIPKGVKNLVWHLEFVDNSSMSLNPCIYSFISAAKWYTSVSHISGRDDFYARNDKMIPVVLDWSIENEACENVTMRNATTYACGNNSNCYTSLNGWGYLCKCLEGYQGNPYLQDGCQDINECLNSTMNECSLPRICVNTPGSYYCSCPSGTEGDGRKTGRGCIPIHLAPPPSQAKLRVFQIPLGVSVGILFVLFVSSLLYWRIKNRRKNICKEKYFQQNGGLLLRQQLSSYDVSVDIAKIFTEEELKRATNNYDENRILGRGGYGTVYKGIFPNNKIVAIKKSKIVDESQVEQFINEVVILSQINHRNVVKFLGCCLESEVPMLVYEFITNGTLFHHIHDEGQRSSLSWDNRLRIAAETASALAYMHSAASPPIFHRDIKSANILLDDNYTAKVSDFGASRLVPLDQTQFTTLVQGTMGYLDPEYFHTSRLTEKSDVYSFGIVLAELLTGRKALEFDRPEKEKSLALHFISSMKEENILDILEDRVLYEANEDQLHEVAKLVERCLRVKGEERPTMKEVAMELEGLRRSSKHLCDEPHEEVECLLGEPPNSQNFNTTEYDSLGNQVVISLDCGR